MEVLDLMFTRRGQITLLAIAIALVTVALGGIIVVVILHGFNAETAALITAWATVVGVLIAQGVATRLAAERAQVDELQAYLKEMGELLSKNPTLRDPASGSFNSDLRILARAHTRTVWSGLNRARRTYVLNYLRETQLLDALELGDLAAKENPLAVETSSGFAETDQQNAASQRIDALERAVQDYNRRIYALESTVPYATRERIDALENTLSQRINAATNSLSYANQRIDASSQRIDYFSQRLENLENTLRSVRDTSSNNLRGGT
jgi:hypothetical protein